MHWFGVSCGARKDDKVESKGRRGWADGLTRRASLYRGTDGEMAHGKMARREVEI